MPINNPPLNKTFLKAEWRKLLMANYAVDAEILKTYLPKHTELDYWNGACYISLVGFMFLNTSVKNIKFPFHINFEEVNLRFYVKYKSGNDWKRGVVFIKEIVPKRILTFVANTIYKEKYETLPMSHKWESKDDSLLVQYQWKKAGKLNSFLAHTHLNLFDIKEGSEEEFITEHFWGYTKIQTTLRLSMKCNIQDGRYIL